MNFSVSVLDYLGKYETGIIVLISIMYQEKYSEATFFYTDKDIVLTISEELQEMLGHPIQQDPDYPNLIKEILKRVVPFSEMYGRIDEIDFNKFIPPDLSISK